MLILNMELWDMVRENMYRTDLWDLNDLRERIRHVMHRCLWTPSRDCMKHCLHNCVYKSVPI